MISIVIISWTLPMMMRQILVTTLCLKCITRSTSKQQQRTRNSQTQPSISAVLEQSKTTAYSVVSTIFVHEIQTYQLNTTISTDSSRVELKAGAARTLGVLKITNLDVPRILSVRTMTRALLNSLKVMEVKIETKMATGVQVKIYALLKGRQLTLKVMEK